MGQDGEMERMTYLEAECECGHTRGIHLLREAKYAKDGRFYPYDDNPAPLSDCMTFLQEETPAKSGIIKTTGIGWLRCGCERFSETLDSLVTRTRLRDERKGFE